MKNMDSKAAMKRMGDDGVAKSKSKKSKIQIKEFLKNNISVKKEDQHSPEKAGSMPETENKALPEGPKAKGKKKPQESEELFFD